MMILVSGSTKTVAGGYHGHRGRIGVLLTPNNWNTVASVVATGLPWAIDNGAYSGFDPVAFRDLLSRAKGQPRLMWVAAPDVVGDARGTLGLFWQWENLRADFPLAFVLQNGQHADELPDADCYFVGGCLECQHCKRTEPAARLGDRCVGCQRRLTEWKLGPAAASLCAAVKRQDKQLHMGRVNSLRRLRVAHDRGCDSVDGSGYSRFAAVARSKGRRDMLLERHLSFVRELEGSPTLF